MKAIDLNLNLINAYLELLRSLSTDAKLELAARLLSAIRVENGKKKKTILDLSGKWVSDLSAEELASQIRSARLFNRQIEQL